MTAGSTAAARPHPSAEARTSFVPRLDLRSGRIVGFLATPAGLRPGQGADDDGSEPFEDRLDREVADVLAVARAAGTSSTTVHLPVAADAVAWAPHRLRAVRPAMLHGAGRGAGVSLLLRPRVRSASTAALERGIAQARRDGFGVALPAGGFAPAEIARLAPDELVLDPACLVGVEDGEACALATLEAATTLARAGTGVLVADGVRGEPLLRELRRRGVRVASGPVLAADQPSALPARATLAPGLSSRLAATEPGPDEAGTGEPGRAGPGVASAGVAGPGVAGSGVAGSGVAEGGTAGRRAAEPGSPREVTLGDVARPATVVPDSATGDEVRTAFADDQDCAGVVLVDAEGRPTGYVDRNRFLLTIAGPYGRAVFAHRSAARLAEPPTLRPASARVREAVRDQLDADPARRYDDTVLTEPDGRTVRVARFADLVRALDPAGTAAPVPGHGAAASSSATGSAPPGVGGSETGPDAGSGPGRGGQRLVGLHPRPRDAAAG